VIHNYVLWRLVMSIMPHMIDEYQQKRVEFRKILLGILSERNRWSQCVEWTNKKLGMAVGALFIRDNFNHESKVDTAAPQGCQKILIITHIHANVYSVSLSVCFIR
jgi:predicted metalloendopeptidase